MRCFCYLGDRLNASGGSEAAVTVNWINKNLENVGELVYRRKFTLKGRIHKSCIRSAMLYGNETWCSSENETAILSRTEQVMMRTMRGGKLIEKRRSQDLIICRVQRILWMD